MKRSTVRMRRIKLLSSWEPTILHWLHKRTWRGRTIDCGDSPRALDVLLEAEKRSQQLGDTFDQENALTNIGYVYMDERRVDLAEQAFSQALRLAQNESRKEHIFNTLRVLARLSLQTGDILTASKYAQQAIDIARAGGNHLDELYPTLVQGQIESQSADPSEAQKIFEAVIRDEICPVFLKWEAQHSLALLYEREKQTDGADREYRAALATFEGARSTVRHGDFQLSFLTNGELIYDDYVHFLVTQGRTDDALRWADYSRARTLSEGLGLLSKRTPNAHPRTSSLECLAKFPAAPRASFFFIGWARSSRICGRSRR